MEDVAAGELLGLGALEEGVSASDFLEGSFFCGSSFRVLPGFLGILGFGVQGFRV